LRYVRNRFLEYGVAKRARDASSAIHDVGRLTAALTRLGLQPTLVGGMALVILGSRRVTRGFDFLIAQPQQQLDSLLEWLYLDGYQLASRLDANGDITMTIDNPRVAVARLRIDTPANASFINRTTRLRVDLLFDFPIQAAEISARATKRTIDSVPLRIACEEDLLMLKRLAHADRASASDAQDIAFLESRLPK
jgi:hypothetical protein